MQCIPIDNIIPWNIYTGTFCKSKNIFVFYNINVINSRTYRGLNIGYIFIPKSI